MSGNHLPVIETEWLEENLKNAYKSNGISKILSINFDNAVPKGDNYTSLILRATAKVVLGSGKLATRTILVKKELSTTSDVLHALPLFKKETLTYVVVLKLMEELMDEFRDHREKLWCDLLGYTAYDTVIFQDLKEVGYEVANRSAMLDLEHGILVLRGLGRLHALSKILLSRNLINIDDLGMHYVVRDSPVVRNLYEGSLKALVAAMEKSWDPEWDKIRKRIAAQIPIIYQKLKTLAEDTEGTFQVMNHGDAWTCNMMFKYSEYGKTPLHVKFIDFQVTYQNSYMWDLYYFIFSSILPSIRRANLDLLFETYQESLSRNLKFYGWTGPTPQLKEVMKEAKRLEYLQFANIVSIFAITTTELKDGFDISKMLDEEQTSSFNTRVFTDKTLIDRIGDDFKYFVESNII